ncbi:hypothetical protein NP493_494g01018 [Ridgeia piscesae]|uniref:Uncharacterized protein n=1 Tax=Ridgeia piscesae TaxID=27915 RepID=A0AAD9NSR5_RIDPI|nr:hypothetical protein NP493_494g01018 [Ridgeia piscesae]
MHFRCHGVRSGNDSRRYLQEPTIMGKKKGGKGKKAAVPMITWNEALLAYKINIKEKVLQDVKYQLRATEEKNVRHKERLARLKDEQALYLNDLMERAHRFEDEIAMEEAVTKDQVTEMMMMNWQATREAEISLAR